MGGDLSFGPKFKTGKSESHIFFLWGWSWGGGGVWVGGGVGYSGFFKIHFRPIGQIDLNDQIVASLTD